VLKFLPIATPSSNGCTFHLRVGVVEGWRPRAGRGRGSVRGVSSALPPWTRADDGPITSSWPRACTSRGHLHCSSAESSLNMLRHTDPITEDSRSMGSTTPSTPFSPCRLSTSTAAWTKGLDGDVCASKRTPRGGKTLQLRWLHQPRRGGFYTQAIRQSAIKALDEKRTPLFSAVSSL
jgi:hypothetical protein